MIRRRRPPARARRIDPERHARLIAAYLPIPPRTEADNERLIRLLAKLDARRRLTAEEQSVAELLAIVIEDFEDKHYALPRVLLSRSDRDVESFAYPAKFRRDKDGRFVVSLVDFERAHTDGKDFPEAQEEAVDLLGSVIAARIADKTDIPPASTPKRGERLVPVPLWIAAKLGLYLAMREQKVSNSELARRLGIRETIVRRMLDPEHATKPGKIEAALAALGKRIFVAIETA